MITTALKHGVQPRVEIATLEDDRILQGTWCKTFLCSGSDGYTNGRMDRHLCRGKKDG